MNYKSQFTLLGLPLIHVSTAKMKNGHTRRGVAKGWIAIGDISFGIILSVGAAAFGGIALGGVGIGLLSFAGLAIGVFAVGGAAIGVLAAGGAVIAWHAAHGGFAMANEYALGGKAIASQANNLIAEEYFKNSIFFSSAKVIGEHSRWFILLAFLPVIQALIHKRKHRESKQDT